MSKIKPDKGLFKKKRKCTMSKIGLIKKKYFTMCKKKDQTND